MAQEYISGEEHQARASKPQGTKVTISTQMLGLIAAVIVLCGLSFYGGLQYQKHHGKSTKITTAAGGLGAQNGGRFGGGQGGFRNGGAGLGSVTAVSDTSITVQNQRTNASDTYTIDSSTTITDSGQTASAGDIKTGDTVVVMTSGSDSKTATRILLNPSFGGGPAQSSDQN